MFRLLYFALLPAWAYAFYTITIFGDVSHDPVFFSWTYPWLMDHVGGHITVKYQLLGSGRHSVPQMCVLDQLEGNTFLQAQYLKCEALGTRSEICLCNSGIDQEIFRKCVLEGGSKVGEVSRSYNEQDLLGRHKSTVVQVYQNLIYDVPDATYLKAICDMFMMGDVPLGCINPVYSHNETMYVEKTSIFHTDCRDL